MTIVVAGVLMNLLLAFVLFYITLSAQNFKVAIPLLSDHKFIGVNQTNENLILVANLAADSPASQAGLKQGERVLTLNGMGLSSSDDLISHINENAGKVISLEVSDPQKTNIREIKRAIARMLTFNRLNNKAVGK